MFPAQISEATETSRIEHFDRSHLPWLAHLDVQQVAVKTLDPETLGLKTTFKRREVLIKPLGYVIHVSAKRLETLEIALWGTLLAVIIGAPLAILSARNLAPNSLVAIASRALVSLYRAVPELISALLFVLAYGFGPIADVFALALHAAGFLGKFYAEDIENSDPRPQEALTAIGAGRLKVLRYGSVIEIPEAGARTAAFWNNRGVSLDELGRHEDAITCYAKALEGKIARYVRRGGGWKGDNGGRTEGHSESCGAPTGA